MPRFRFATLLLTAPFAVALVAAVGCGGGNKEELPADNKSTVEKPGDQKPTPTSAKTELPSTGWGTLQGKVTYDGDPPAPKDVTITKNPEVCACQAAKDRGDTQEQKWKIGPDKGVADVVVWVRAPKGTYFKVPDDQKERKDVVTVDQPYCAFEPHVTALYPSYYDGKKQQKTGQVFQVANSASLAHNTNYNCVTDPMLFSGRNLLLDPKKDDHIHKETIAVKACKDHDSGGEQEISLSCNVHPWMSGYVRIFDHPFVAVTKGDLQEERMKDVGTYEIKQVPAGVELEVVYWHESMGQQPKVHSKKIKLEDGKTETLDLKIK